MTHFMVPSGTCLGDLRSRDVSLPPSKRFTAHHFALTVSQLAPTASFHDISPNARLAPDPTAPDTRQQYELSLAQQSRFSNVDLPSWAVQTPALQPACAFTPGDIQPQESFTFTPHDTYRYPESPPPVETSAAPPMAAQRSAPVNTALAQWYVEQVIDILIQPGHFREPVGGASDEVWGPAGVEKASWERLGHRVHRSFDPWGRAENARASPPKQHDQLRRAIVEPYDPYVLTYGHGTQVSPALVAYFDEVLLRMAIPTSSVVAALWYLKGIAFHEGDGPKGARLRRYLREAWGTSVFAIEKRVAVLGLMLAGKWLDDNSYLVKSWSEISELSSPDLIKMDRLALEDLHFSLSIPVTAWTEHVSQLFTQLVARNCADDLVGSMIITYFDEMVIEARASELAFLDSTTGPQVLERRLSMPPAADQAIDRAWGSFARSYQVDNNAFQNQYTETDIGRSQPWDAEDTETDDLADRAVSALVDDNETEEEFLEYDGAQRWIPPVSELRRSDSDSSSISYQSTQTINQWRLAATADQRLPDSRPSHSQSSIDDAYSHDKWTIPSQLDFWPAPSTHQNRQQNAPISKLPFPPSSTFARPQAFGYPRSDTTNSPVPYFDALHDPPFWLEPGITASRQQPSQFQHDYPYAQAPSYNRGFGLPNTNHQLSGLIR